MREEDLSEKDREWLLRFRQESVVNASFIQHEKGLKSVTPVITAYRRLEKMGILLPPRRKGAGKPQGSEGPWHTRERSKKVREALLEREKSANPKSFQEIGNSLGLSREAVYQHRVRMVALGVIPESKKRTSKKKKASKTE